MSRAPERPEERGLEFRGRGVDHDSGEDVESFRAEIREFVDDRVLSEADAWDRRGAIPEAMIRLLGNHGYLAAMVPRAHGGRGLAWQRYAVLNEELGRGCSSLRTLITVHGMVCHTIARWGSREQREKILPSLATGEAVAAVAFSESGAGSDLDSVETRVRFEGEDMILDGAKQWISFGQVAGLFLVLAQSDRGHVALLVDRDRQGVCVESEPPMLGTRASLVARLRFDRCRLPQENMVGRPGFGFSYVAGSALDNGRFSVACGCVGLAQAALEVSLRRARQRVQFGSPVGERQLVQRRLANSMAAVRAARLLCNRAAELKAARRPEAIIETTIAKYFSAGAANEVANHAVQIHGALGCSSESSVSRLFRDARVMEIIEGSTEMQQLMIAQHGLSQ